MSTTRKKAAKGRTRKAAKGKTAPLAGILKFRVTHANGLKAQGMRDLLLPGSGHVVIVKNLECTCGFTHTLTGIQNSNSTMSGVGWNSVVPPSDGASKASKAGQKKPPGDDEPPSWDGGPSTQ